MKRVIILVALAVAACGPSKEEIAAKQAEEARAEFVAEALDQVRRAAFDPSSVDFRDLKVGSIEGLPTLCGELNANNRYGAKAGFRGFVVGPSEEDRTKLIVEITRDNKSLEEATPCIAAFNRFGNETDEAKKSRFMQEFNNMPCQPGSSFDGEFWIVTRETCEAGTSIAPPVQSEPP